MTTDQAVVAIGVFIVVSILGACGALIISIEHARSRIVAAIRELKR